MYVDDMQRWTEVWGIHLMLWAYQNNKGLSDYSLWFPTFLLNRNESDFLSETITVIVTVKLAEVLGEVIVRPYATRWDHLTQDVSEG